MSDILENVLPNPTKAALRRGLKKLEILSPSRVDLRATEEKAKNTEYPYVYQDRPGTVFICLPEQTFTEQDARDYYQFCHEFLDIILSRFKTIDHSLGNLPLPTSP
jgi:hypothetical protein